MLTQICQELRNWFDRGQLKTFGEFSVSDGTITGGGTAGLKSGQYYRILGSTFNDGVHVYPSDTTLVDEDFEGAVWGMAVPSIVVQLASDVQDWVDKYAGVDSVAMSPYNSESFGGYSYSKASGGASGGTGGGNGAGCWQSVFANRLNPWRKI